MRPRWLTGVLLGKRRTLGNLAAFFPGARHRPAVRVGRRPVRSVDHLERRRLGARALAGQADPQGNPRSPKMRDSRWRPASMPSSCPITAAASSTAPPRPSPRCRAWSMPSRAAAKCCSMAASPRARTCSRRWRSAHAPASSARRFSMGWRRMGGEGVTLALQLIRRELEVSMALTGVDRCARRRTRAYWCPGADERRKVIHVGPAFGAC